MTKICNMIWSYIGRKFPIGKIRKSIEVMSAKCYNSVCNYTITQLHNYTITQFHKYGITEIPLSV